MNKFMFGFLVLFLSLNSYAEEKSYREKIRQRLTERREAKDLKANQENNVRALIHNGLNRKFLVHVPKKYTSTISTPLIVAMHGGGGDMFHHANDKFYKLISKSEAEGFIVVFPNGFSRMSSGKLATWNAGKCCGKARDKSIDDVGFIREVISNTMKEFNIDKNKVFATGMSNGGMMAYRLACEMSDVFKAVAPVAGTDNTIDCVPKNPISILHIHAKNDTHVLFSGGAGSDAFRDKTMVTDFKSVPESIQKWVKFNNCHTTPKRVLEKEGAYCEKYTRCKNNVEVQLCVTEKGGHSWPGGVKNRGDESPSQVISANDEMWNFFKNK